MIHTQQNYGEISLLQWLNADFLTRMTTIKLKKEMQDSDGRQQQQMQTRVTKMSHIEIESPEGWH